MDFSKLFSAKIHLGDIVLENVATFNRFEEFVLLANRYRRFFRKNFIDQSKFSIDSTREYFRACVEQRYDRFVYVVYSGERIIGHYGVRRSPSGEMLLDNAVRFNTYGGRYLFREIQIAILMEIRKAYPMYLPKIIVGRDNLAAMNLHNYFHPEEFPDSIYSRDKIDRSKFYYAFIDPMYCPIEFN